jgi:hypothetical protein
MRMEYSLEWKARLTFAHTLAERRPSPSADTFAAAAFLGESGAGRLEIPHSYLTVSPIDAPQSGRTRKVHAQEVHRMHPPEARLHLACR